MRSRDFSTRFLLALVACGVLLSGCAVTNRLFRDHAAEERAAALLQMQLAIMRFADEYTARVNAQVVAFQHANPAPADRLRSQSWLVSQATSAFTIASGPNPELNAIDMLVFATLSRMVMEDRWVGEDYGARAEGLLDEHRALEARIWAYSTVLLTKEQGDELRSALDSWHAANPLGRAVPFIHLEDFAFATSNLRAGGTSNSSIFSFLGIDPLSNLDPAVRELAQSRQLAERAVYYGQRAPMLVSMEAQRLAFELAVAPETVRVVDSVGQINRDSLRPGEDTTLDELLAANRGLLIVYVMRDALKELWQYRHTGYARRAWVSWYRKALRSGLEPLRRFARRLRPYLSGILAHCRYPLGTNLIEGINNKIKVIKRMAYGFRDDAYFFLKIRAAFPGVGR